MAIHNPKYSGGERPHLISLPPTDEHLLLERFPKEGLAYDPQKIIEATLKVASEKRSERWSIGYSSNLRQAEILFSSNPSDPNYRREGIVVRGGELSVYYTTEQVSTSRRAVFRDGLIAYDTPEEIKIAAMRAFRTLRLAPQLPKL